MRVHSTTEEKIIHGKLTDNERNAEQVVSDMRSNESRPLWRFDFTHTVLCLLGHSPCPGRPGGLACWAAGSSAAPRAGRGGRRPGRPRGRRRWCCRRGSRRGSRAGRAGHGGRRAAPGWALRGALAAPDPRCDYRHHSRGTGAAGAAAAAERAASWTRTDGRTRATSRHRCSCRSCPPWGPSPRPCRQRGARRARRGGAPPPHRPPRRHRWRCSAGRSAPGAHRDGWCRRSGTPPPAQRGGTRAVTETKRILPGFDHRPGASYVNLLLRAYIASVAILI